MKLKSDVSPLFEMLQVAEFELPQVASSSLTVLNLISEELSFCQNFEIIRQCMVKKVSMLWILQHAGERLMLWLETFETFVPEL